jgi:hypothetical protein
MSTEPTELDQDTEDEIEVHKRECDITIFILSGYLLVATVAVFVLAAISGQYERLEYFGSFFVGVFFAFILAAIGDFFTSIIFFLLILGVFGISAVFLIIDFKHFLGVCNKPYCEGFKWIFFIFFFGALAIQVFLCGSLLIQSFRLMSLEDLKNKQNSIIKKKIINK